MFLLFQQIKVAKKQQYIIDHFVFVSTFIISSMILKLHSFIFLAYIICSKGYFTKRFIPLQKLSTKSYCTIKIGEGVESDKRIIPFNAVNTIDKTKINALIGYKFSRPHTIKVILGENLRTVTDTLDTGNATCIIYGSRKGNERIPTSNY